MYRTDVFTEYRADGWPLCPKCGEDELMSLLNLAPGEWERKQADGTLLQACVDAGLTCLFCGWELPETLRVETIAVPPEILQMGAALRHLQDLTDAFFMNSAIPAPRLPRPVTPVEYGEYVEGMWL